MRACRKIVIIQFGQTSGRNHFPGPTKTSRNKGPLNWLSIKQGRLTCSSYSTLFGTSHAPDSSPRSVSRRWDNDRVVGNYPRPYQRGHLRRPCAGCLPHRLACCGEGIKTKLRLKAAALRPQWHSSDAGGAVSLLL